MGHLGLEISSNIEGDPLWKPSDTTATPWRSGTAETIKLGVTRSFFFELETPDFAWKFDMIQKKSKVYNLKWGVSATSLCDIFDLKTCMHKSLLVSKKIK